MKRRLPMLSLRSMASPLAALELLIVLCSFSQNAFAGGNVQGTSCPAGSVSAGIGTGAVTDANNLVCVGGTWQYPAYVMQSYSGTLGASCTGYPAGALHYSTTANEIEFCNGTNWNFLAAGSTSCGTPSGLAFTNLTAQSLSTVVTSNAATITFSGCATPLSVSVSGAATAQISVNGGTWSASGAISSGQTLQVRMTTSGSVSTTLTATVTVGSTSANWTTTTRSGSLNIFQTSNSYTGNFGGLSGADAVCQSEANSAGYAGTYMAVMSDNTTNAASRLTLSYPIVNAYDGSTVASTNLWGGSIANTVKSSSGGGYIVWSGSTTAGTLTGTNCNNWTSASSSVSATNGQAPNTNGSWIDSGTLSCNFGIANIICIQQ